MIRFDAYSATTREASLQDVLGLVSDLCDRQELVTQQGRGFHTFGNRIAFKDGTGTEYGSVMWGGRQQDRIMVEVKGDRTPQAVAGLRSRWEHRVTRVDACADFDAPGAFDGLLGPCLEVKKNFRLKGSKLGDWDDFPEDGRTLYIGSTASPVRARLYEKGKQPEYRHLDRPDWTRLEVQARPAKEAKTTFSELTPSQVWGASTWTRDLAARVLQQHVDPHPAGTVYKLSERDRALSWMCKQYGAHLVSLANDLGGWECVGLTLKEMISEQSKKGG